MRDALGDRMKHQYENRTRLMLPRRTYTIVRLDGKSFHTYTRGCDKPYDNELVAAMDAAAAALVKQVQGCDLAYTQSDEISLLLTDFATVTTDAWFDGNAQKIVSVAASIATAAFNAVRIAQGKGSPMALFDARTFTIPEPVEVHNYFVWRQKDCVRNSVSSLAQTLFSPAELDLKSQPEMHEMIHQAGDNWANWPAGFKNGRLARRVTVEAAPGVVRTEVTVEPAETWTRSPQLRRLIRPLPALSDEENDDG